MTIVSMKKFGAVLLCLCILLQLAACGERKPKNADKNFVYQLSAEPKTLDPQVAADSSALVAIEALYEGLARLDADGKPYPGVAEKWEADGGQTEFTFTLRKNAVWTDKNKTPVTADDFVFAFRRALDPATGSSTCTPLFEIQNAEEIHAGKLSADRLGVTAKDSHTLVVKLKYADADFPAQTAQAVFMPCHKAFFESTGGRYGLEYKYLLGNGPFRIDGKYGWDHGNFMNLVRSDTYAGNRAPLPSSLKLTITGKDNQITDPVAALTAKTVDAVSVTAAQAKAAAAAGASITSFQNVTWGLCFNTKSGLMKSRKLRAAFVQALNRSALLKTLPGDAAGANSVISPSVTLGGKNYLSLTGGRSFFLEQSSGAASLLAAGLAETPGQDLKAVSIVCPDDNAVKLVLNQMISDWNAQFHSYFSIEPLDSASLAARLKSGNYQLAFCPVQPGSGGPYGTLSLFNGDFADNPAHWNNTEFTAKLEAARQKSGDAAVKAYMDAESVLSDQAVFYPVYYTKSYYASAKGVTGIVFHPFSASIDFIQAGKE